MPAQPEAAKPITLRPFVRTDLADAYALDQVCFSQGIAYSRAALRHFVSRPSAYAVVAERAGQMAGFLIASHHARQVRGLGHIVTLDVDPGLRRMGVASLLMEHAERYYRELRRDGIELEVAVNNEVAQKFYIRHGFEATGLLAGYYNGVLDALTMRKRFVLPGDR